MHGATNIITIVISALHIRRLGSDLFHIGTGNFPKTFTSRYQ